jgi:hypothetical protein
MHGTTVKIKKKIIVCSCKLLFFNMIYNFIQKDFIAETYVKETRYVK